MSQRHQDQYEIRSMGSGEMPYNNATNLGDAITMDELDRLKLENEERIRMIENKYFQKKEDIKKVKQELNERSDLREPKEKHYDSSLNYPTYGRGFDPTPDINTYMINKSLC